MLKIRSEQIDALGMGMRGLFVEEMIEHLNAFSPELCQTLGDDQLRPVVCQALERAEGYGLVNRGSVRLFLEMMFLLGSGFDDDPQYPWARETLLRDDFFNEMYKSGRLEHLLREYLDRVHGPENENAQLALLNLRALAENLAFPFRLERLAEDIRDALHQVFQQKLHEIGPQAVAEIISRARLLAQEVYGAEEPRPTAVLAILMFSFGAGCATDPLYPWIGATLRDERIVDAASRADRLERKAVTWLKAVIEGVAAAQA